MSDYLAVGGVSAVLRSMLTDALTQGGPSVLFGSSPGITATSPDLIKTGVDEQAQLNLFMYYVSLNPALRNLDLPSMNGAGARISNPPLALNLHYLVSAYGAKQFDPEILLAWAMKVFHDTPVVPSTTIQAALTGLLQGQPNAEAQLVSGSTLAEQIEHLRITPETLSTEEIYRLWGAFQTAYRPSTALQVSVAVIQDNQEFTSNLPVQTRTVLAQPLQSPIISAISPSMAAVGQVLRITGSNFLGDAPSDTLVSFDFAPGIAPDEVQGRSVQITLPANLAAGLRLVRVQRAVVFASSPTPHPGFSSSPAPFQLIPTIHDASPVQATQGSALTLTISPDVGRAQLVTLYIGDHAIPIDQRPTGGLSSSSTLTFPIPTSLPTGTFPIRVEIDGAQSLLSPLPAGGFTPQVQVSA
jgi:Pvc16 N-terminal domain